MTFVFQLHEYKAGTPEERTYFVELWDIGGATQHKNSRYIFYNPVHGKSKCLMNTENKNSEEWS